MALSRKRSSTPLLRNGGIAVVWLLVFPALAAEPHQKSRQPVSETVPADALTAIYNGWAQGSLHDFYEASGNRNPSWDADAHRLIAAFVAKELGDSNGLDAPERRALWQKLQAAGCSNPVLAFLGTEDQTDRAARAATLRILATRMAELDYTPILQFLCNAELFALSSHPGEPMTPLGTQCLSFFRAAVGEHPLPEESVILLEKLLDRPGPEALALTEKDEFCTLLKSLPAIPPWLSLRVEATRRKVLAKLRTTTGGP